MRAALFLLLMIDDVCAPAVVISLMRFRLTDYYKPKHHKSTPTNTEATFWWTTYDTNERVLVNSEWFGAPNPTAESMHHGHRLGAHGVQV